MWGRVWQMACRLEQIPDVGDSVVYDAPGLSLVVVRSRPGRGPGLSQLLSAPGHPAAQPSPVISTSSGAPSTGSPGTSTAPSRECPVPWDFPHVEASSFCLPEARVGTWGGFVFVTVDHRTPEPRGLPRDPSRALRVVGPRRPVPQRPRRPGRPLQLEGGPRGLHRELPHRGRPSPAAQDQRRHPDPVRRLRGRPPRQPDDHAGRDRQRARRGGGRGAGHPRRHVPHQGRRRAGPRRGQRPPGPGRAHPAAAGRADRGRLLVDLRLRSTRRHRVLRLPQLRALGGLHDAARLPVPAPWRRPHRGGDGRHAARADTRGGPPAARRADPSPRERASGGRTPPSSATSAASSTRTPPPWPASSAASSPLAGPDVTLARYQESRIRHFHATLGEYLEA